MSNIHPESSRASSFCCERQQEKFWRRQATGSGTANKTNFFNRIRMGPVLNSPIWSVSSKPTTEFSQPPLSRVKARSSPAKVQIWVCLFLHGRSWGCRGSDRPYRNKHYPNLYPLAGDDRALTLLKGGSANSGGFGAPRFGRPSKICFPRFLVTKAKHEPHELLWVTPFFTPPPRVVGVHFICCPKR